MNVVVADFCDAIAQRFVISLISNLAPKLKIYSTRTTKHLQISLL